MAGTLTVSTLSSVSTLNAASGVLATQNGMTGIAKAWVKFSSGTTIDNSFNVSSLTRNSTGNFTITFTTAMPNTNYAVVTSTAQATASQTTSIGTGGTYTTTQLQLYSLYFGSGINNFYDPTQASVAIFSS